MYFSKLFRIMTFWKTPAIYVFLVVSFDIYETEEEAVGVLARDATDDAEVGAGGGKKRCKVACASDKVNTKWEAAAKAVAKPITQITAETTTDAITATTTAEATTAKTTTGKTTAKTTTRKTTAKTTTDKTTAKTTTDKTTAKPTDKPTAKTSEPEDLLATTLKTALKPLPPGVVEVKAEAMKVKEKVAEKVAAAKALASGEAGATPDKKSIAAALAASSGKKGAKPALAVSASDPWCKVTTFSTKQYDKVKHTVASRKSYIQYFDHDENRWVCLFSTTHDEHRKWSTFMVDQVQSPDANIDKLKEVGKMIKLGQLKIPEDWRERGICFGGESADSRSCSTADDED